MESVHQGTTVAGQSPLENKRMNKLCWWLLPCKGFTALPYTWGQILLSIPIMADWSSKEFNLCWCTRGSKSASRGAQFAVFSEEDSTQLIWVSAASSLIYNYSGFSMNLFREKKNWGGKLELERGKTIAFGHSLTGDTVCSVERKLREIALLPFKHSEYILNIKTDFSFNIFLSPGKINVVWFGTLVNLLVNASVLFRY